MKPNRLFSALAFFLVASTRFNSEDAKAGRTPILKGGRGRDEASIAPRGAACYARAMTTISRRLKSATMKAGGQNAELEDRVGRYALRRGPGHVGSDL